MFVCIYIKVNFGNMHTLPTRRLCSLAPFMQGQTAWVGISALALGGYMAGQGTLFLCASVFWGCCEDRMS